MEYVLWANNINLAYIQIVLFTLNEETIFTLFWRDNMWTIINFADFQSLEPIYENTATGRQIYYSFCQFSQFICDIWIMIIWTYTFCLIYEWTYVMSWLIQSFQWISIFQQEPNTFVYHNFDVILIKYLQSHVMISIHVICKMEDIVRSNIYRLEQIHNYVNGIYMKCLQ